VKTFIGWVSFPGSDGKLASHFFVALGAQQLLAQTQFPKALSILILFLFSLLYWMVFLVPTLF
jgi:hypothetical protein